MTDEEFEYTAVSESNEDVVENESEQLKTAREDYDIINGFPHYKAGYRVDEGQIEVLNLRAHNYKRNPEDAKRSYTIIMKLKNLKKN